MPSLHRNLAEVLFGALASEKANQSTETRQMLLLGDVIGGLASCNYADFTLSCIGELDEL